MINEFGYIRIFEIFIWNREKKKVENNLGKILQLRTKYDFPNM